MSPPPPPSPPLLSPSQALPAAGVFALSAASLAPHSSTKPTSFLSSFLHPYLSRVLENALSLSTGHQSAILHQSLDIVSSPSHLSSSISAYLSASSFPPSSAQPLFCAFLTADIASSTAYDARSRETLCRTASALHLPQRVVWEAERELATLVHDMMHNATDQNGSNVEAVEPDAADLRRRKGMRWLKVGAASVVGGLALGLSGGLIAPALIPALGSVGLTGVSGSLVAMGSGGAVAVGGVFGAAGASVGAAAMSGRTAHVTEFKWEKCVGREGINYQEIKIRRGPKKQELRVQVGGEGGGVLVWELLLAQEHVMIVPGGITLEVVYRDNKSVETSILPEEKIDAGGVDRRGEGRKRRKTGAITVVGDGEYLLRFSLLKGSLPVVVRYRVEMVPLGKDAPAWVMEENEEEGLEQLMGDVRSLSMAILVPGLLSNAQRGSYPGMCADQFGAAAMEYAKYDIQTFALRWESELLIELSDALKHLIGKMAVGAAAQRGAMMVAPALIGAVALPVSILGAIRTIIGNVWARAVSRAVECGYLLAAELAGRSFGNRPVVLAGYSLGGMVIFSCLQELARRELSGIVHDVCVMGAPCSVDAEKWASIRRIVSGRLVNVYYPKDWYLEIYSKGWNLGGVAGTRPVRETFGVENICLGEDDLSSHMDYAKLCNDILFEVGFTNAEYRRGSLHSKRERSSGMRSKAYEGADPPPFPSIPNDLDEDDKSHDEAVLFEAFRV